MSDAESEDDLDILSLAPHKIQKMGDQKFRVLLSKLVEMQQNDRKENALLYYQPVSENSRKIHLTQAKTVGVGGGNRSSKTETCIAHMSILCTGIVPHHLTIPCRERTVLASDGTRRKLKTSEQCPACQAKQTEDCTAVWDNDFHFRGPVSCRVVCESLTTVLHPILLPKLQWYAWTGLDAPGGSRGHYGWIPRTSLIAGSWERSWSEKLRTLRVLHRDPNDWNIVTGESKIQFCSIDQDPSDFASGEFHMILHDEPPGHTIWREDQARCMSVNGRNFLAMTWPDDPSIPVDWIFDEVYEPGNDPDNDTVEWINLFTTDNPNLDQHAIADQMRAWSPEVRDVRIYGRSIRFSNRIHPEFTDETLWWCFDCRARSFTQEESCQKCGGRRVAPYNHVDDHGGEMGWPVVWLIDPHPRKPHMWIWVQVTPSDDLIQLAEGEMDDDPDAVAAAVTALEEERGWHIVKRLIDPNMGRSPASSKRGVTWQDEFDKVGLRCDLASDSDVGRGRINEYLKPDGDTLRPRIGIDRGCTKTVFQFKRYVWDDHKRNVERDQKQTPKTKNDDFPTLWKYLLNEDPTFRGMAMGAQIIRRRAGIDRTTRRVRSL